MTYKIKEGEDWVLYRSPVVEHEQQEMIRQLGRGYRLFKDTFTGLDSSLRQEGLTLGALPELFNTDHAKKDREHLNNMDANYSGYRFYNLFALTSPSPLFWLLLQDIYGYDNFPTTSQERDILKFKGKSVFNNFYL